jgi:hypothetical protein
MKQKRFSIEYSLLWTAAMCGLIYLTVSALTGCSQPEVVCEERDFIDGARGAVPVCRKWGPNPYYRPSSRPSQGPSASAKGLQP